MIEFFFEGFMILVLLILFRWVEFLWCEELVEDLFLFLLYLDVIFWFVLMVLFLLLFCLELMFLLFIVWLGDLFMRVWLMLFFWIEGLFLLICLLVKIGIVVNGVVVVFVFKEFVIK